MVAKLIKIRYIPIKRMSRKVQLTFSYAKETCKEEEEKDKAYVVELSHGSCIPSTQA